MFYWLESDASMRVHTISISNAKVSKIVASNTWSREYEYIDYAYAYAYAHARNKHFFILHVCWVFMRVHVSLLDCNHLSKNTIKQCGLNKYVTLVPFMEKPLKNVLLSNNKKIDILIECLLV